MTQRKKFPNLNHDKAFFVSEPRYLPLRRKSVSAGKFGIFAADGQAVDLHVDKQISHAIYEIEIANSDAAMKRRRK